MAAGRDFTAADRAGSQPVVIVGEAAAQHFWPGQNAIGRSLSQSVSGKTISLVVVGIAKDIRSTSLIDGVAPSFVYVPLEQQEAPWISTMTLVTRARQGSVANDVRKLVASMNPNIPIALSRTLEDSVALGLAPQRIAASISGGLGMVGLLLAAIGIYGVTSFAVSRRMREFGIRIALGAQRRDVLRIVLRQGLGLVVAGCAIGLLLAAAAAQLLTSVLLGLSPMDPVTFAGAAALFVDRRAWSLRRPRPQSDELRAGHRPAARVSSHELVGSADFRNYADQRTRNCSSRCCSFGVMRRPGYSEPE